jgi:drug/metabolite transporter (DMT)-like permease
VATMTPLRSATLRDMAMMIMLGTIWGSSFFFVKIAVADIPPLTIAAGRVGLAALCLYLFIRVRGRSLPRDPKVWRWLIPTGIFNSAVPFFFIALAEQSIDSGLAAVLMAAGPIWALILSHFFTTDDRFTTNKVLGTLTGFGGVIVIVGPMALLGAEGTLFGAGAIVLASISYMGAGVMVRKVHGVPPDVFGAAVLLAGTASILPFALVIDQPWTLTPALGSLASVFYLGVVATAFAAIVRFRLLMELGMTFFSQVVYIITIAGVLLGAVLLSEPVTINMVAGMLLIFVGIYFSQRKSDQAKPAENRE